MKINGKIKLFASDVIVNTFSFSVLTIGQQLIALPIISKVVPDKTFGQCITILAVINILSIIFGENVGNTRLITKNTYEKLKDSGDFKYLIAFGCSISTILFSLIYFFIAKSIVIGNFLMLMVVVSMSTLRLYLVAEYRIKKEFRNILSQNIVYFCGLVIGMCLLLSFKNWIIVFLCAETSAILYSLPKSLLSKERFTKSPLFVSSLKTWGKLGSNSGITSSISYIDRLLIFPILGPAAVGIYFAASIVAKMGVLIINPLNGVLLSWFSDIKQDNVNKMLKVIIFVSIAIGCIYFVLILCFSPVVLKLIYPEYYSEGVHLIAAISLASAISIITSILKPFLIRFGNLQNLIFINITYGVVFIILGILLSHSLGLRGFAFSAIISQGVLLALMLISAWQKIYMNKRYQIET